MGKSILVAARVGAMTLLSGVALAQVPAQPQQPMTWEKLPRMQLETSFAGPMQDTAIQR